MTELNRTKGIFFLVSEGERAIIKERASQTGQSVSAYVRHVSIGYKPTSKLDNDRVVEFMKESANLSRLGNLLKLWLMNDEKAKGFTKEEIRALFNKLDKTGDNLYEMSRNLLKKWSLSIAPLKT